MSLAESLAAYSNRILLTEPPTAAELAPRVGIEPDTEDPYAGLNRAQRRKAIAVESRSFRKSLKQGKN